MTLRSKSRFLHGLVDLFGRGMRKSFRPLLLNRFHSSILFRISSVTNRRSGLDGAIQPDVPVDFQAVRSRRSLGSEQSAPSEHVP